MDSSHEICPCTGGDHLTNGFVPPEPSNMENVDGLNGAADGFLHKGTWKCVSARPLNTGFMYKKPKIFLYLHYYQILQFENIYRFV